LPLQPKQVDEKHRSLQNNLRKMESVLVAFSGGVDSTLLLKVAKDVLGDKVFAVTADSDTTAVHERQDAVKLAQSLGAKHLVVESAEMNLSDFVSNPPDKCYVCKKSRFGGLVRLAGERGIKVVVDGENVDDGADYRPGSRAARELGVRSPLREAGLSKTEIRFLAKKLNLPNWNRPAYACLASRIPYNSPITPEKLRQVDAGEDFIRGLIPAAQVRVRHYGDTARIEIDSKHIPKLAQAAVRHRVVNYFKQLGFTFVTLDLEGYSAGSLNRAIRTET